MGGSYAYAHAPRTYDPPILRLPGLPSSPQRALSSACPEAEIYKADQQQADQSAGQINEHILNGTGPLGAMQLIPFIQNGGHSDCCEGEAALRHEGHPVRKQGDRSQHRQHGVHKEMRPFAKYKFDEMNGVLLRRNNIAAIREGHIREHFLQFILRELLVQ